MNFINIEIKARCDNPAKIRNLLKSFNANYIGLDHQIDTYFNVAEGRLKLREGNIENNLIHYYRANTAGPKLAEVILYRSDPKSNLKEILIQSLGILTIVDKQREIYFIDNVKFHIDQVKHLGGFFEIEAINSEGNISKTQLSKQCNNYLKVLEIHESSLISVSYSDLLLEREK